MGESGMSWKEQFHVVYKENIEGHTSTTPQFLMPGRTRVGSFF